MRGKVNEDRRHVPLKKGKKTNLSNKKRKRENPRKEGDLPLDERRKRQKRSLRKFFHDFIKQI